MTLTLDSIVGLLGAGFAAGVEMKITIHVAEEYAPTLEAGGTDHRGQYHEDQRFHASTHSNVCLIHHPVVLGLINFEIASRSLSRDLVERGFGVRPVGRIDDGENA